MFEDSEIKNIKFCENCNIGKNHETGFYKAGKSYQRFCKPCHNKRRILYKISYVKKITGFKKLNEEIRKNILEDYITYGNNLKWISEKYNLNHKSLLNWKHKGQLIYDIMPTDSQNINVS